MSVINKYFKISAQLTYEVIPSSKGKHNLILVEGNTFSVQGANPLKFYCSKKTKTGCAASILLNREALIFSYNLDHNHAPPNLYRTKDGRIINIK